jgi:alpha-ketoglutarate-dependent taurine dioxygenase
MLAQDAKFTTTDLTPLIGTAVRTDAGTLLSGTVAKQIRALLEQRGVLVFPKIDLDDERQNAFTRTLGTQAYENNGVADEHGNKQTIFKVSLDSKVNPIGEYFKVSFFWHLDGPMHEVPILASILSAKHIPSTGAATEFCNTYAAYDALPESDKKAFENLAVVHANWALQRYVDPEPSYAQFRRMKDVVAERTQPLVWKHRSGRRSLVLGATAAYVVGMDPTESWDVLVRLRDWATQPQFVYRHEWTNGDTVMWDNTGTLHRAIPYSAHSGRLLHRTILQGEEAFA